LNADLKGITLEEAQQELSEELGDRIKNDPRAAIENEVYMAKAGTKLGMEYIKKAPLTYGKIHLQGMVANVIIPLGFTPLTTYFTGKLPSAFPAKESILHDAFILLGKGKIGAAFSLIWQERIRSIPLIVLLAFITSLIFQAVILIGCVKFFKSSCFRNKQFYLLLFLVLYFLFVTGPLIDARFRIPIEPWLSILAICGLRRKNIVVLPGPV
jgi:hypothetical protein